MPVQYLDICDQQDVGQRADNFLIRTLKGVPKTHIYRILRRGEVRINGGRVKANYRLQLNDRVRIPPIKTRDEAPLQYSTTAAEQLTRDILFENEKYLVINKPAGVAVHGGSGVGAGVIEILRDVLQLPRLELIHRLDRDTSGCLAMAKNRQALVLAQTQFRKRSVKKIYETFVWGQWPAKLKTVQLKLQRYQTSWGERRVKVSSSGQAARTDFLVIDRTLPDGTKAGADLSPGYCVTRLQATLHTGRTHQIRVHTSANSHPILGDDKYGRNTAESYPELPIQRLCLHAKKLVIPLEGDLLKVTAAVPADMESIWQQLDHQAST